MGEFLNFLRKREYISSFAMAPVAEIITLDKEGNFYLFSSSYNTVTKYDPQGAKVFQFPMKLVVLLILSLIRMEEFL